MNSPTHILMVDDHPIILEGYKTILSERQSGEQKLVIDTASTCGEANEKLERSSTSHRYDLVLLDINLPASGNREFCSGEDIGMKIRKEFPGTKLIVLTMLVENLRLQNILRLLNPEGFLIKSDVNAAEFLNAFDNVMNGRTYCSQTVQNFMRNQVIHDFRIDKVDRDILYYLSKGMKSKEIPDVVPISLPSVEKRKKDMRKAFGAEDTRDITLINKARELGFL